MEIKTAREWHQEWEKSGISKSQFCRQNDIPYWKLSLKKAVKKQNPGLLEVRLPEIKNKNQIIIHWQLGFGELSFSIMLP